MAKTEKYKMLITTYNLPTKQIELSKKEFNKILKDYKKEVEQNNKENDEFDDSEYFVKLSEHEKEHEYYMEYSWEIADGATYITFFKLVCKEGYHFNK